MPRYLLGRSLLVLQLVLSYLQFVMQVVFVFQGEVHHRIY
jgi:hypothetical protein